MKVTYMCKLCNQLCYAVQGKFIFKNGRVYEGMFEKDHIVEYPLFSMDSVTTPDLSQIRTRTPLPMGKVHIFETHLKTNHC